MTDKFSNEERLKRQIKDLNAERLHKNLLIESLRDDIDQLKAKIAEYEKLVTSLRNQFDLWADGGDFADIIEAQIENLEGLNIK